MSQIQVQENDRQSKWSASAAQEVFNYDFPITAESELTVTKKAISDGAVTNPSILSSTINASGGTVTIAACADGDLITIQSNIPVERSSNYLTYVVPTDLNYDFNKITKMVQELRRDIGVSLSLPPQTGSGVSSELPEPLADSVIGWDSGGTALEYTLLSAIANPDVVSQVDAEAGTATDERIWTAERVKQAILALETGEPDQTGAEIKALYEAEANAFTDALFTKLAGIESSATADQTAGEILTAIKTVDGAGSGLDADLLDGLSSLAFVKEDGSVPLSANWDVGEFDILSKRIIAGGGDDTFPVTADVGLISENLGKPGQLYLKDLEVTKTFGSSDTDGTLLESNDGVFTVYGMSYTGTKSSALLSVDQAAGDVTIAGTLNTHTIPAGTDTLVGKATTDTLTNKTLVAPILGTPTSGTLTNCTGYPASSVPIVDSGTLFTATDVEGALAENRTAIDALEAVGATNDQTAGEILTAIKTVDGAASGLDADLLDGLEGAVFPLLDGTRDFTGKVSIDNTTASSTAPLLEVISRGTNQDCAIYMQGVNTNPFLTIGLDASEDEFAASLGTILGTGTRLFAFDLATKELTIQNDLIAAGGILIGEEARYDAQFALALTGAVSWNVATNPYAKITAPTGAITLTLTTNSLGSRPSLVFTQHATVAQTLTVAVSGGTFAWEGGTAPDLTTLSSVFDMSFHCYDGTNVIGYWGKVGA
mgnify:CR=1 FL=1